MPTLLLACVLAATPDAGAPPTKAVMQGALEALVGLEPMVAHPERLRDPLQADDITRRLDVLAELKHAFPADAKAQEPATAALSGLFSHYALETRRRFVFGERETIAARVRTLMSLCFTCHSRERVDDDFRDMEKRLESAKLAPLDKAQFLAATRQFDKALEQYAVVIAPPANDERARLLQTRAIKDTLTLLVRVKDDAKATDVFLEGLSRRADLTPFLQRSVQAWRKDVAAWRKENVDAAKATPRALFTLAKALVAKASGPRTFLPDETHEVAYLRASAYLNLALGKDPTLKERGEALFLLGVSAGALKSPLLWDVDLLFFEACVRENPKTPLAQKCFAQFSDRLTFGFTGSAGTHLPDDELARLSALRALAE
ncbi:MAG: hypothetical protein MUC96_06970 [Myxococcaceae bacterium]|jgi:hypothetical protein|nr:hypothetical protein [Myxococcaceae bacterium]